MRLSVLQGIVCPLLTGMVLLSGCAANNAVYSDRKDAVMQESAVVDKFIAKQVQDTTPTPPVVVKKSFYVDQTPINLMKNPAWMRRGVSIHASDMPFAFFAREIMKKTGANVRFQDVLDSTTVTSMAYSGSIEGALDKLSSLSGYVYEVRGKEVLWRKFVTKTFNIAFLPGDLDYSIGGEADSGGEKSGASTNVASIDTSSGEYSNLKSKEVSLWKDLESTVEGMLSSEGKVSVSVASSSITVTGLPQHVEEVGRYIERLNHDMMRQVLIKVMLITVELEDDSSAGINWNIVRHAFDSAEGFKFSGDFGTPITITPSTPAATTVNIAKSIWKGTSILLNALNKQGRTSIVTEPSVVTMNNQVAVVKITQQEGYIADIKNSTNTSDTGNTVTSEINPGQVVTGLNLFLLPRIMNNKIYLQVSSGLSTLIEITDLSVKDGGDKIQQPKLDAKKFNERAVITDGSTLVLAGYRELRNNTSGIGFLPSHAFGGKGSEKTVKETIVLITPMIMDKDE